MRVLVVGGDGMLGHRLLGELSNDHDVRATLRRQASDYSSNKLFNPDVAYYGVDVRITDQLVKIFEDFQPNVVVNAVGIVKQRNAATKSIPSIEVNALFPHKLAVIATTAHARVVHLSTDCVFSGNKGHYIERDRPDPVDLYGHTKLLGEIHQTGCVTLRTSIIGLEIANRHGLIEWFLAQDGPIKGYSRAIYSGLTTNEMARVIDRLITGHPQLTGVWHVGSEAISKCDLLVGLSNKLGWPSDRIEPDDRIVCDRSLNSDLFRRATGYAPPSWDDMLQELADEIHQRRGNVVAS